MARTRLVRPEHGQPVFDENHDVVFDESVQTIRFEADEFEGRSYEDLMKLTSHYGRTHVEKLKVTSAQGRLRVSVDKYSAVLTEDFPSPDARTYAAADRIGPFLISRQRPRYRTPLRFLPIVIYMAIVYVSWLAMISIPDWEDNKIPLYLAAPFLILLLGLQVVAIVWAGRTKPPPPVALAKADALSNKSIAYWGLVIGGASLLTTIVGVTQQAIYK
jgi:hypothetical protein